MKGRAYQNEVVWIIGASSGIGKALAVELANAGARVILSARRKEALDQLKSELPGSPMVFPLDVTDSDMVTRTAQAIRAAVGRLDRVIFMSAVYTPMELDALDITITKHMLDVNLGGAFHTVHAVLPILLEQKGGQLALCASVAGYVGLPGGQPYSATKAGLINLCESLYAEHARTLDVKLISPGFVRTALTDKNDFAMPMILTPEAAAKAIARGLLSKRFEIHFPWKMTFFLKLLQQLPYRLSLAMTRHMYSQ